MQYHALPLFYLHVHPSDKKEITKPPQQHEKKFERVN